MKNNSIHKDNDVFLAQWMADEITDIDFKKLVSLEEFVSYKKLKEGILLYEKFETTNSHTFKGIQNKINRKTKVRKLYSKWAISVAASVILFFGVYSFLNQQSILNKTTFGEQKTIALLDGSEVILSAKSEISYTKKDWQNNRELHLNGEAFFKVKKGSTFTVITKNGIVKVLGTQFNVNSKNDFFEVVCYTGKVKVSSKNETFILKPTESIRKIKNKIETLTKVEPEPTWLNGVSTYKSTPLKYVLSDLEKQFNIKFDSSKINTEILFTGNFNHKNKETAFATVFKAMLIDFTNNKKVIVLTNKH